MLQEHGKGVPVCNGVCTAKNEEQQQQQKKYIYNNTGHGMSCQQGCDV